MGYESKLYIGLLGTDKICKFVNEMKLNSIKCNHKAKWYLDLEDELQKIIDDVDPNAIIFVYYLCEDNDISKHIITSKNITHEEPHIKGPTIFVKCTYPGCKCTEDNICRCFLCDRKRSDTIQSNLKFLITGEMFGYRLENISEQLA